jgi:DnaK suppressor protein
MTPLPADASLARILPFSYLQPLTQEGSMRSIRQGLERERRVLSQELQSTVGSSRDADRGREFIKDPYGTASLAHDHEVSAAVVEHRARRLADLGRALEELDAGRYGVCQECGAPIPKARLEVMPFATRCVACQARVEGLSRAA